MMVRSFNRSALVVYDIQLKEGLPEVIPVLYTTVITVMGRHNDSLAIRDVIVKDHLFRPFNATSIAASQTSDYSPAVHGAEECLDGLNETYSRTAIGDGENLTVIVLSEDTVPFRIEAHLFGLGTDSVHSPDDVVTFVVSLAWWFTWYCTTTTLTDIILPPE